MESQPTYLRQDNMHIILYMYVGELDNCILLLCTLSSSSVFIKHLTNNELSGNKN